MEALTEHFGTTCVAGMKNAVLGMDDRTVELQQQFNALVSQYQQVLRAFVCDIDFHANLLTYRPKQNDRRTSNRDGERA